MDFWFINVASALKLTMFYQIHFSNSGSFRGPTLSTVYFIHCGTTFHDTLSILRKKCGKYFAELLSQIDTSIPDDLGACRTLANLLKNVFILQTSDHEIWPWDVYLIKSFSFLFNVNFNEMNCTEDILTIWAFKKGKRCTPPKDSIPAIFADVYTFVKRGVTH